MEKWKEPDEVQRELLAMKTELNQVTKSHNNSRKKGNTFGRKFNKNQKKDHEENDEEWNGSDSDEELESLIYQRAGTLTRQYRK